MFYLRVNDSAIAQYDISNIVCTNAAIAAGANAAVTQLTIGRLPEATAIAGYQCVAELVFPDYALAAR